jgi:hypothetical protein
MFCETIIQNKNRRYYCNHNRQKSTCKECKGGSICEHNRIRSTCKDCKGSQICEHNKIRSKCKDCNGGSICEHNRQRSKCKDCVGGSICEHNKERDACKDCGGSKICEHNRERSKCIECGGASICEHNKMRNTCKICGGSKICKHNKFKSNCKECDGRELCKSSWCHTRRNKKYNGYCLPCFVNNPDNIDMPIVRNYKTKEKEVVTKIKEHFQNFTWIHDKKIIDGCSKRRPDLLCDFGSHIIIIEIDETKHNGYECSCENKRLMELSQDLDHRPIVMIRFNPDGYTDKDGNKILSCWKINKLGIMSIKKKKMKNGMIV